MWGMKWEERRGKEVPICVAVEHIFWYLWHFSKDKGRAGGSYAFLDHTLLNVTGLHYVSSILVLSVDPGIGKHSQKTLPPCSTPSGRNTQGWEAQERRQVICVGEECWPRWEVTNVKRGVKEWRHKLGSASKQIPQPTFLLLDCKIALFPLNIFLTWDISNTRESTKNNMRNTHGTPPLGFNKSYHSAEGSL